MPVQTDYNLAPRVALAGQVANLGLTERFTYIASEPIIFGRAVARVDGNESKCKTFTDPVTNLPLGVAERIIGLENGTDSERLGYNTNEEVSVVTQGYVWVVVKDNVTAGNTAYITNQGTFTGAQDSNFEIKGAIFEKGGTAGGLALLKLPSYRE